MPQSELEVKEEIGLDIFKSIATPTRENIAEFEETLKKMPQVELPLQHLFIDGAYMRCITLPKDTALTSKIHRTQHFSLVVTGDVTISKPDGSCERVQAPHIFITEPNTKRAIYAHEETTWVTFHVTDKTDIHEIEKDVIAEDYE
jgi:hypothetical protein